MTKHEHMYLAILYMYTFETLWYPPYMGGECMSTDAKRAANSRYLDKVEQITVRFPAGSKETIKAAADLAGEPLNTYIVRAVQGRLKGDDK